MGTPVEITVFGDSTVCRPALSTAFSEMARIESLLSVYRKESELARFNVSRDPFVPLSAEVRDVTAQALRYAEITDGAFDPTLGPLIRLWGFGPGKPDPDPSLPRPDAIAAALQRSGFRNLKLCDDGVERRVEGMELNLGGIGKGYAIDRAVHTLKSAGVARGLVHCGSTSVAWGDESWPIAVRHPRQPDATLGLVPLRNAALATSGDYEQFFMRDGQRYSHLIDSKTGCPAQVAISATVTAKTAMAADALSTAAFILGHSDFLEGFSDTWGWVVTEGGSTCDIPLLAPSRRHFLAMAASVVLSLLVPWKAWAAVVYMTEDEALRAMMPDADRFDTDERVLSAAQLKQAQKQVGRTFSESRFQFRIGRQGEAVVGYAMTLDVIGKERPITFLIGIAPTGAILGVEVLIYRESEGSEVRYRRFTKQFSMKTKADALRLGGDIQPISGATLSSRAAVHAVRKALSVFEVVYKP